MASPSQRGVIASHPVPGLEVSDHELDRSKPLELAFDLQRHATLLAGGRP